MNIFEHNNLLCDAMRLAIEKHGEKYFNEHLYPVYEVIHAEFRYYNFSDDVRVASILHDILEDTGVTPSYIVNTFGSHVYDIVWLVTDKDGKSRVERYKNTYPMIKQSLDAIVVKLADRIQNVMRSPKDSGHYKMYKKEYSYFREILYYKEFPYLKMWDKLDELMEWK